MLKNEMCHTFYEEYCKLIDRDKELFTLLSQKLLKINYIIKSRDKENYNFMLSNKKLFISFFTLINFETGFLETKEIIYIKSKDRELNSNIKKNETIILLCLRILYQNKLEEVNLSSQVEIKLIDLSNKLINVGFNDVKKDRVKQGVLKDALKLFKDHNIISYIGELEDDSVITIYPSIEVVMDFRQIQDIVDRLSGLTGGNEDEDNED